MTIKKRLFWSNILMILVPVIATALIGIICIGVIWLSILHGTGFASEDPKEFTYASMAVAEIVEHKLDSGKELDSLGSLLDKNKMRLTVKKDGAEIFTYGEIMQEDNNLLSVAESLNGEVTIAHEGRSVFMTHDNSDGSDYAVYLFGGNDGNKGYNNFKIALMVVFILLACTIILSILMTNRFLTKFIFKRIEDPLDILADGVRQIRDGNLDYRIAYSRNDEFLPVCGDFNEMAARLKQSIDMIQKQQQSRKELLAGISHDIRSPLTSIKAYVEGLIDGVAKTSEARSKYLKTIKTKAEDLDRMVSQLFVFSKMELGEYPDNPCIIQMDEAVAQFACEVRDEYLRNGMEIELKLEPAAIYADPVQIRRIIANLFENSLKYMDKEHGKIIAMLNHADGKCRLSVSDDGPGVRDEALPHLFEVFYRSDPSRQNPNKGSGLGLAIVANAVQQAGGTIHAQNSVYGGLEIEMFFPEYEVKNNGENIDN